MAQRPIKIICGVAVGGGLLLADYAAGHAWPLWSITLAGAVFVGGVVAYLLTAQSQ